MRNLGIIGLIVIAVAMTVISFETRTHAPTAAPAAMASRGSLPLPLLLEVATAPAPFAADGRTHLAYELHITNLGATDVTLTRIDVVASDRVLAHFEGAALTDVLGRRDALEARETRTLSPGVRAIAFLWITCDTLAELPDTLSHQVAAGDRRLDGGRVSIARAMPPIVGPPLKGGDWMALNGPSNTSGHRRALIPLDGRPYVAQRFAIDWIRTRNGESFAGDPKENRSYFAYGADVLAVADGTVASIKDGIPENVPGIDSRAVPITLETIAGNYVIVDIGASRYALFAHLQPGSLRVKAGDHVTRGQVLGLVGNSGNSTGPHLHFHLTDSNTPLAGDGLPYGIERYEVLGPDGAWQPKHDEIPLSNARVRFSD